MEERSEWMSPLRTDLVVAVAVATVEEVVAVVSVEDAEEVATVVAVATVMVEEVMAVATVADAVGTEEVAVAVAAMAEDVVEAVVDMVPVVTPVKKDKVGTKDSYNIHPADAFPTFGRRGWKPLKVCQGMHAWPSVSALERQLAFRDLFHKNAALAWRKGIPEHDSSSASFRVEDLADDAGTCDGRALRLLELRDEFAEIVDGQQGIE